MRVIPFNLYRSQFFTAFDTQASILGSAMDFVLVRLMRTNICVIFQASQHCWTYITGFHKLCLIKEDLEFVIVQLCWYIFRRILHYEKNCALLLRILLDRNLYRDTITYVPSKVYTIKIKYSSKCYDSKCEINKITVIKTRSKTCKTYDIITS